MEQKAGGKHGGIGLNQLFKARGRNPPFPVQAARRKPLAGCKPWERSLQSHLTYFRPSSPVEEQVRLNAKGYHVCLAFCALGYKGIRLRKQNLGGWNTVHVISLILILFPHVCDRDTQ